MQWKLNCSSNTDDVHRASHRLGCHPWKVTRSESGKSLIRRVYKANARVACTFKLRVVYLVQSLRGKYKLYSSPRCSIVSISGSKTPTLRSTLAYSTYIYYFRRTAARRTRFSPIFLWITDPRRFILINAEFQESASPNSSSRRCTYSAHSFYSTSTCNF